jgi:hypothetical protein
MQVVINIICYIYTKSILLSVNEFDCQSVITYLYRRHLDRQKKFKVTHLST